MKTELDETAVDQSRAVRAWKSVRAFPARILIFLIELYRTYVSPLRMPTCRFMPTCSEYAVDALRTHGVFKGIVLTVVRLAKCAPWHPGGWDPVPARRDSRHRCRVNVDEQRST
ncbi:MAG: membrane protein insertion efficiency factor YidD [Rhodococcus sp. (in: high G+C Gram-positive bacteria)]|uniref:membrane protein insertion efficiency factor YidD n=1 Tax=Rhodococcus sp. TaxID=1831 RepID=UPI003BB1C5E5